ncbi:TIGR03621 family F420-dependent LLM class oxidoreductase [Dactylosporangium matsuzakiense]|uniref:LLM class F420-dependent oxidoreductase n=1 Tax=Dactylosporangium matsuzakiense TaxID=53360 RepID=A0A9W6NK02_9ACTN|nr:TIGR03621 family F420-dependent LLM class oxidoreductase [Dactylosporangium matsuzakiense]GLK99216.1 LLM class F420-dependent oxidoreductase [Dactylosporangium matsuzakiense]
MNDTRRPFRFGVLTKGAPSRAAWHELLGRIEGSGYSALHMPLHTTPQYAPFVALADAAARTALTLTTLVHNNDLQHPALLARDASTLALLSDGRFELGIGAGWKDGDYHQLGLPMDPGRLRVERLGEAIDVVRRTWSAEPYTFKGKHYTVQDLQGLPGPRVPLLVGAGGERMLRLAARTADIVSFTRSMSAGSTAREIAEDVSLESTERKAAVVREHLGARAADVELHVLVVRAGVGDDARRQLDEYAAASEVSAATARQTPEHLLGRDRQELEDLLLERRARTGISYYVFRDVHLDLVRPVIEHLAGT